MSIYTYIYIYNIYLSLSIYIYRERDIHTCIPLAHCPRIRERAWSRQGQAAPRQATGIQLSSFVWWRCLSNATCLVQPHLCYALFVVPRTIMLCYIIRHV